MCVYELTPESDTQKSTVESSTPMATVKNVKLYFDTCASNMSTPFKEDFVTRNENHTEKTSTALLLVSPLEVLELLSTLCLTKMANHKP